MPLHGIWGYIASLLQQGSWHEIDRPWTSCPGGGITFGGKPTDSGIKHTKPSWEEKAKSLRKAESILCLVNNTSISSGCGLLIRSSYHGMTRLLWKKNQPLFMKGEEFLGTGQQNPFFLFPPSFIQAQPLFCTYWMKTVNFFGEGGKTVLTLRTPQHSVLLSK